MTRWTIELPAGIRFYTLNRPAKHWAAEQAKRAELRKIAWALALRQKIPVLERVALTIEYQPPAAWRRGDPDNLSPVAKGIIDGLVAAGVLEDDDSRHVASVACVIGPRFPKGRLLVHIFDLAGTGAGS